MNQLKALREQRAKLHEESEAIVKAADENGGEMNDENLARMKEIEVEIGQADDQVTAEEARATEKAAVLNAARERAQTSRTADHVDLPGASITDVHDLAGDDLSHGFANLGEFGRIVMNATGGGVTDERLLIGAAASGMNQSISSEGGFLVPPAFSQTIWDGMNQGDNALLPETDTFTIDTESLSMPANAETSRATGSRYGGVRGYWMAEADQMTSSKPKLRQLKLEPKQMGVLVYATDKLLANTRAAEQYLSRAAISEIQFMTSDAIIEGDGSGKPLGILSAANKITIDKEVGQVVNTVVTENIVNMYARLHPRSRSNAVWLYNQEIEPQLMTLTITRGTSSFPVFLPAGGLSVSPFGTILGRPARSIEFASALGTEGDLILTDLKSYASGVKGGINTAMSIHLRFDYNETAFRFLFEVDGQPWLASPITPFKGNDTLSTTITIESRT